MDATTVRARLRAEGIACTVHRDGTLTASLLKRRDESWVDWLTDRVKAFPGAVLVSRGEWQTADPGFRRAVVRFRLGPAPENVMVGRADSGRAA